MNEFNINLVGKQENIKKEEILNNFDFNYLPINNLPISYFPIKDPSISDEIKNKDLSTENTADFINDIDTTKKILTFTSNNSFQITKDIYVDMLLVGGGGGGGNNNITITGTGNNINITSDNSNYSYALFRNNGTFIIDSALKADVLIVGGGGGGSYGGGGGGGVLYGSNITIPSGSYDIIIGAGGISRTNGKPTTAFGATCYGGGFGGYFNNYTVNGGTGGSGGGAGASGNLEHIDNNVIGNVLPPIKGTILADAIYYGNNGGLGGGEPLQVYNASGGNIIGGGGGGGGNNGSDSINYRGGNGGDGVLIKITGDNYYWGGGGGGFSSINNGGNGGKGGGGGGKGVTGGGSGGTNALNNGINASTSVNGNGGANTGGGGGGSDGYNGGYGGSGVVIIRYKSVGNGGGGGGGEVKYLKEYKLKKGIYDINIGNGGILNTIGQSTYLNKNNIKFIEAIGGNYGNGLIGGAPIKYHYGKGADTNILTDNSTLGELIDIDGTEKYYGNGGLKSTTTNTRTGDKFLDGKNGDGGNENGYNGIFILKYKDNDINFIKKYTSLTPSINITGSGFTIQPTNDNSNYKLIIFRSSDKTTILTINKNITCDILLVGGGGAGAKGGVFGGGGGGAGSVIYLVNEILRPNTYKINIGIGGIENSNQEITYEKFGKSTFIYTDGDIYYCATGGGYGAEGGHIGFSGGSSGGSSGGQVTKSKPVLREITNEFIFGNKPTGAYGNIGGGGSSYGNRNEYNYAGGGGGGANNAGGDGSNNKDGLGIAGNGGNGKEINITGTNIYYGGGGGGGCASSALSAGLGGSGGGGAGSKGATPATSGEPNTGSGGGGGGFEGNNSGNSGAGGSGIIIIRVKKEDLEGGLSRDEMNKLIDKDTRIIKDVKDEFRKKMILIDSNEMPYNKFSIFPLTILILFIWIFIFLFLLKFVHHYFTSIYLYILICIIIFLLLFGSMWFLYSNNDL